MNNTVNVNPQPPKPPNGLKEILHFYGANRFDTSGRVIDPANWADKQLFPVLLPNPLLTYGNHTTVYVVIHRALRGSLSAVMQEILLKHEDSYHKLFFAGSYNPRLKRGVERPSLHALGCAIDFNDSDFPFTAGKVYAKTAMPAWYQPVIEVFQAHGWKWGGDFGDPMHFQYATGY